MRRKVAKFVRFMIFSHVLVLSVSKYEYRTRILTGPWTVDPSNMPRLTKSPMQQNAWKPRRHALIAKRRSNRRQKGDIFPACFFMYVTQPYGTVVVSTQVKRSPSFAFCKQEMLKGSPVVSGCVDTVRRIKLHTEPFKRAP